MAARARSRFCSETCERLDRAVCGREALTPTQDLADREWKRRRRVPCPRCGGPATRATVEMCQRCVEERHRERMHVVADLFRAGEPLEAIASAIGSTANSVGTDLARLRAEGWDLPSRLRPRARS